MSIGAYVLSPLKNKLVLPGADKAETFTLLAVVIVESLLSAIDPDKCTLSTEPSVKCSESTASSANLAPVTASAPNLFTVTAPVPIFASVIAAQETVVT